MSNDQPIEPRPAADQPRPTGGHDFLDLEGELARRREGVCAGGEQESWLLDGEEPTAPQVQPPAPRVEPLPEGSSGPGESAAPLEGEPAPAEATPWLLEVQGDAEAAPPPLDEASPVTLEASFCEPEPTSRLVSRAARRGLIVMGVVILGIAGVQLSRQSTHMGDAADPPPAVELQRSLRQETVLSGPAGGGRSEVFTTHRSNLDPNSSSVTRPVEPDELTVWENAGGAEESRDETAEPFDLDAPAAAGMVATSLPSLPGRVTSTEESLQAESETIGEELAALSEGAEEEAESAPQIEDSLGTRALLLAAEFDGSAPVLAPMAEVVGPSLVQGWMLRHCANGSRGALTSREVSPSEALPRGESGVTLGTLSPFPEGEQLIVSIEEQHGFSPLNLSPSVAVIDPEPLFLPGPHDDRGAFPDPEAFSRAPITKESAAAEVSDEVESPRSRLLAAADPEEIPSSADRSAELATSPTPELGDQPQGPVGGEALAVEDRPPAPEAEVLPELPMDLPEIDLELAELAQDAEAESQVSEPSPSEESAFVAELDEGVQNTGQIVAREGEPSAPSVAQVPAHGDLDANGHWYLGAPGYETTGEDEPTGAQGSSLSSVATEGEVTASIVEPASEESAVTDDVVLTPVLEPAASEPAASEPAVAVLPDGAGADAETDEPSGMGVEDYGEPIVELADLQDPNAIAGPALDPNQDLSEGEAPAGGPLPPSAFLESERSLFDLYGEFLSTGEVPADALPSGAVATNLSSEDEPAPAEDVASGSDSEVRPDSDPDDSPLASSNLAEPQVSDSEPTPRVAVAEGAEEGQADASPAPQPKSGGVVLRAVRQDRWESDEVPGPELWNGKCRIATPNVGQVEVIIVNGSALRGRLHSIGEGKVWLDTDTGRISFHCDRVREIHQGERDSLVSERVCVTTEGGVFFGELLARDGGKVTLRTDDGLTLKLSSDDVRPEKDPRRQVGIRRRSE